jgi:hypothetical protein
VCRLTVDATRDDEWLPEEANESLCAETAGAEDKWRGCFLYHLFEVQWRAQKYSGQRNRKNILGPATTLAALYSADKWLANTEFIVAPGNFKGEFDSEVESKKR